MTQMGLRENIVQIMVVVIDNKNNDF